MATRRSTHSPASCALDAALLCALRVSVSPVRVVGRWLLYTLVGCLLLVMLLGASGDWGGDEPKGSLRSIGLSIGGLVAGLLGASFYGAHRAGGSAGALWPVGSALAWILAAGLILGAWASIAADLRREAAK